MGNLNIGRYSSVVVRFFHAFRLMNYRRPPRSSENPKFNEKKIENSLDYTIKEGSAACPPSATNVQPFVTGKQQTKATTMDFYRTTLPSRKRPSISIRNSGCLQRYPTIPVSVQSSQEPTNQRKIQSSVRRASFLACPVIGGKSSPSQRLLLVLAALSIKTLAKDKSNSPGGKHSQISLARTAGYVRTV